MIKKNFIEENVIKVEQKVRQKVLQLKHDIKKITEELNSRSQIEINSKSKLDPKFEQKLK